MNTHRREWTLGVVLALVLGVMAVVAPSFYEPQPLLSRWAAAAPKLVVAAGVALVMLTRQIDISVGSAFAVSGVVGGLLAAGGMPWPVAAAGSVAAGSVIGCVNAALVAGLRLPSIVVTLATMVAWREALRLWRQGVFVNLPDSAGWFGMPMVAGQWTVIVAAFGVVAFLGFVLRGLAVGRWVHATGSDPVAAHLAGLRPDRVTAGAFVMAGALAGLASVLQWVQSPQVDPASGRLLELEAVAMAVVGGIAVTGGRGGMPGVLLAFALLSCVAPMLTYLGVKAYWEKAIHGVVILVAALGEGRKR